MLDIKQGLLCSKFRSLKNGEVLGKRLRKPFIYKALRHLSNGFVRATPLRRSATCGRYPIRSPNKKPTPERFRSDVGFCLFLIFILSAILLPTLRRLSESLFLLLLFLRLIRQKHFGQYPRIFLLYDCRISSTGFFLVILNIGKMDDKMPVNTLTRDIINT